MNSFLLALTAVLIVVLSALFAAPLFIDWNDYRPVFETQASKLLGRDVKVGGKVHLVLLPAPELRFDEVKVADDKGGFEEPLLEARSIEAWLNVGALLRGAVEARKIAISEPVLRLAIKDDGTGNWSDVGRPGEQLPFAPKEVLLDEVSVTGGRVEFLRPGAQPLVFDDVYGEGSAASLSGPYKVSTSYLFSGRPQELRFSTSASDANGLFRLKTALRDPERDATYLLEGDVTGFQKKPSFDGAMIMRIASALPPEGQTAEMPPQENGVAPAAEQGVPQLSAFELKGKLTATPDRAELPDFEIAVHSKGRSQMMKGKLALEFGEHTKADAEIAASWVDVDALLAAGAPAATPAEPSAAASLTGIAERALKEAATIGDGKLAIALEQASIGGDLVGGIDLVVSAKDGAVIVERLQADLPGSNRIEASGRLAQSERGPVFEGPVTLDGSKLKTLVRWAAGARDMSGQATEGAFTFTADTVIGGGELKLDNASGELSGTKFGGALNYRGGDHRVVNLTLDSDRLDLREVMGESASWQSWLPDAAPVQGTAPASDQSLLGALRNDEVHATMRVGELMLPNIPPGRLDAKFSLAKDNLEVERLDFTAPGAVALTGNGRIERVSESPAGQADLSLQAFTADGLKVATELLGLGESVTKSKQLPSLAPLDMHVSLTAGREGDAASGSIEMKGKAGGSDVAILAKAKGDLAHLTDAAIDINGSIEGERPQALLGLLMPGLAAERLAVGAERGKFTLLAKGVPSRSVTGRAELTTEGMQLAFDGEGSLKPDGMTLAGIASAKGGNAGIALALFGLGASPNIAAVPLDLSAEVTKTASDIDLRSISGEVDGVPVQGSAHFDLGAEKPRFDLTAKVESASLPSLLGSLIAWQRTPATETLLGSLQAASDVWPARGFALEALGNADGNIRIEADTLSLGAPFQVRDATLIASVSGQSLSIAELQGTLFGGSFAANGSLVPKGTGAELKAHAELATGRLEKLSQALAGKVLTKGPFTFVMDVSGEGLSPPGLVAGLSGDGALFLDPGTLQALSPEPLKRVAVETNRSKKLKLDKDQIAARVSTLQDNITKGTYAYRATALPFTIKNGTLKLDPAALAGKGAETTINGYVELASLRLDSEWAMRLRDSRDADMPPVNLVFAGSLRDAGAIEPQIDTAPMEGFLTVRRMEGDVERLETLDVSGRGQPEAEDDGDATSEADLTDDSGEPDAQATSEDLAAKKLAVEKRAANRAAEAKRIVEEKAAEERRAAEQAAAEKRAAEKVAAEKAAAERAAAEQAAAEQRAAEKAAAEKALAEKRAAEKAAAEKRAAEKAAAEKAAAEKRAAEKAAREKALAERRAAEKAAAEKRAAEKAAAEKVAAEKRAAEKAAAEKAAAEKRAAEKAAAEKRAAEKAAAEKAAAEKRAAEKAAAEQRAAEKAAAEKAAAEQRAAEKAAAEKAAAEKAEAEKAAAEKAAAEKIAAEKAAAERAADAATPSAENIEANTASPAAAPAAGQGEQLPWRQDQGGSGQTAPADAASGEPAPAAAAQEEIASPVPPPSPPPRRKPKPKPAPDDWKKGISIFGGG